MCLMHHVSTWFVPIFKEYSMTGSPTDPLGPQDDPHFCLIPTWNIQWWSKKFEALVCNQRVTDLTCLYQIAMLSVLTNIVNKQWNPILYSLNTHKHTHTHTSTSKIPRTMWKSLQWAAWKSMFNCVKTYKVPMYIVKKAHRWIWQVSAKKGQD